MPPLHVLVVESDRDASRDAAEALRAAGHTVLRCHDDGAAAFPCYALREDRECPLRTQTVDVALTVRAKPRSQPAPHEDGVLCALERHVPVVVSGSTVLNPFERYATIVAEGDVVAACETAAVMPLPAHSARATTALHAVEHEHGLERDGAVTVRRRRGRLLATVEGGPADAHVRSVAAVRIVAALRELDRDAAGIDVV